MPDALVSLSCEVSPQMREYERFNTVIANAYIKPLIKSYLHEINRFAQSNGGYCPGFPDPFGGRFDFRWKRRRISLCDWLNRVQQVGRFSQQT